MENLIFLRKQHHISQQQLADALGISRSALGFYEQDRISPSVDTLLAIADYFGVSVDYLLGHETHNIIHLDSFSKKQQLAIDMIKKLDDDQITLLLGRLAPMTGTPIEEVWNQIKQ